MEPSQVAPMTEVYNRSYYWKIILGHTLGTMFAIIWWVSVLFKIKKEGKGHNDASLITTVGAICLLALIHKLFWLEYKTKIEFSKGDDKLTVTYYFAFGRQKSV